MVYERFVEIGRVAYVAYGPDEGKLIAVVDIIDATRVLADGPCTGVARKALPIKQLHLTKFVIQFPHSARTGVVKKAWEKGEIDAKWAETTWAKKLDAKKKRANLTDFDRFKLMKAKQTRNRVVSVEFGKLRKAVKKAKVTKRVNKKQHLK